MLESDRDFINQISGSVEGEIPEVVDRINELDFHKYGRAIRRSEGHGNTLIGYILPMNEDQTRHLILLVNGVIVIIEPLNEKEREIREYKERVPAETPFLDIFGGTLRERIKIYSDWYISGFSARKVASNEDLSKQAEIEEAIKQAMSMAKDLKERRDSLRKETVETLLKSIDDLLNSPN